MVETSKVGERGQVTIPKEIREREGIEGGDEVEFEEKEGEIKIRKKEDLKEKLIEGYKARAEKDKKLAEEWENVTAEANQMIEDL